MAIVWSGVTMVEVLDGGHDSHGQRDGVYIVVISPASTSAL